VLAERVRGPGATAAATPSRQQRLSYKAHLKVLYGRTFFCSPQGSSIRFIKQLISSEIYSQKDATTLFRGNTIATKCVDYWMHMIGTQPGADPWHGNGLVAHCTALGCNGTCRRTAGHDYLVQVLKKPINDIFSEKKTCELDESRLDKSKSDVAANRKNLIRMCIESGEPANVQSA